MRTAIRADNWASYKPKPVDCHLDNGMIFKIANVFVEVRTDYHLDGFWEHFGYDEDDTDKDDEIVSFIVTLLPKTFSEFLARYGEQDWDAVRDEINSGSGEHLLESIMRRARFLKGKEAACMFASLLDDLRTHTGWMELERLELDGDFCDVSSVRVGDLKRIFDPKVPYPYRRRGAR